MRECMKGVGACTRACGCASVCLLAEGASVYVMLNREPLVEISEHCLKEGRLCKSQRDKSWPKILKLLNNIKQWNYIPCCLNTRLVLRKTCCCGISMTC